MNMTIQTIAKSLNVRDQWDGDTYWLNKNLELCVERKADGFHLFGSMGFTGVYTSLAGALRAEQAENDAQVAANV